MEKKLGFLKGLLRANGQVLGDIEGPVTPVKSGKMPLSIVDGKLTMWAVREFDKTISKGDVLELKFEKTETASNLASNGGKPAVLNVYSLKTAGGTNILRVVAKYDDKVMSFLK